MILIASSSCDALDRLKQRLGNFDSILTVRRLDGLRDALVCAMPQVLLLDIDLPGLDGAAGIGRLRNLSPATKIVAVTTVLSHESELALFRAGVRGCCRTDIDAQVLRRMIFAVEQGELWFRRSTTSRLLDEMRPRSNDEPKPRPAMGGCLTDLTRREREIAVLIGDGESNKRIARQLSITERTVKAHLTGIFRKLGIADRLGLALRVTARPDVDRANISTH